jgi:hypothetical protein
LLCGRCRSPLSLLKSFNRSFLWGRGLFDRGVLVARPISCPHALCPKWPDNSAAALSRSIVASSARLRASPISL